MTDDEYQALCARYRKAVANSTPEDEKAFACDAEALDGDWVQVGRDMRRAIDKVGRERCSCSKPMSEHLNGGACGAFKSYRRW